MMYYFVPVLLKKPVWSHTLSLVGFWGLAFFYPLNGVHHFFWSPIPMYAQYGAVMSTIAVEIVVFTVIVNFFMTLRGRGELSAPTSRCAGSTPAWWVYFITCFQCAFQTTLTSRSSSTSRTGCRGPRAPRHVRRVQLLDLRHDRVPLAQARRRGLVLDQAQQPGLLAATLGLFVMFIDLTSRASCRVTCG
jgi:hypothetical protein